LPYHLDVAKQIAGRLALRFVDDMEARINLIVAERERLIQQLSELPLHVYPSGANFVLFRPNPAACALSGREIWQRLVERSILIRDCSSWPRLEHCLRITIGTPEENDALITGLREIVG
jgi:histidinol-phosphate aminotransferase